MSYQCPCCKFRTITEEPPGTFEICPVCGWEDDDTQFKDPSFSGGANKVSLEEARKNFASIGAIDSDNVGRVRKPSPEE